MGSLDTSEKIHEAGGGGEPPAQSLDHITPVPETYCASFTSSEPVISEIEVSETVKALRAGPAAIKVQNVWKHYDDDQPVLKNFNMTVPKGSIYSLLGSSGCGKTTILNCIVGRQKWDSGKIRVLGLPPSSYQSSVHCKKIGYMPQDLALQPLLTIREVLMLYGRLHGMTTADIQHRLQFLQGFLQLPKESKVISNLSGGQQRRVSMAAALLHSEAELIILDEPTVGLDPLLRQSIWEHLQDLVQNLQVAILLTTHYIDEARRSNMIGLMRHGRIIAEESPQHLMRVYNSSSLDDIVLKLCRKDAQEKKDSLNNLTEVVVASSKPSFSSSSSSSDNNFNYNNDDDSDDDNTSKEAVFQASGRLSKVFEEQQIASLDESDGKVKFIKYNIAGTRTTSSSSPTPGAKLDCAQTVITSSSSENQPHSLRRCITNSLKARRKCVTASFATLRRIKGLIWATYLVSFRHPAFVPLTFILPALTSALVQFVFGSPIHDLKFGYVNLDEPFSHFGNFSSASEYIDENMKANCFDSKFSHLFLSRIPSNALHLIPYPNKAEALEAVQRGNIWGFLNIPENYTTHMKDRMLARLFSEPETIDGSIIGMYLDMSSYLGSLLIIDKLAEAYKSYLKELAASCDYPAEEFDLPLRYEEPVYGKLDGTYAEHVVPGMILVLIFVLPLGACSIAIIQERRNGSLERMRVAGMANWDIIVTYFVTHGSFQVVQMTLCTLVLVFGFSYVIYGPILLYIILNCCNAFCGLAFGFLLGLLCETELQVLIVVFFLASVLLPFSGAFWPIESLAQHWRILAYSLPTTLTSQSFRSVVFRGLSYTHPLVWPGLVVPLAWMSVFLTIGLLILRRY